ncbi:MAG: hypothetical protein AABY75_05415 [Bacteroidota bacterium]
MPNERQVVLEKIRRGIEARERAKEAFREQRNTQADEQFGFAKQFPKFVADMTISAHQNAAGVPGMVSDVVGSIFRKSPVVEPSEYVRMAQKTRGMEPAEEPGGQSAARGMVEGGVLGLGAGTLLGAAPKAVGGPLALTMLPGAIAAAPEFARKAGTALGAFAGGVPEGEDYETPIREAAMLAGGLGGYRLGAGARGVLGKSPFEGRSAAEDRNAALRALQRQRWRQQSREGMIDDLAGADRALVPDGPPPGPLPHGPLSGGPPAAALPTPVEPPIMEPPPAAPSMPPGLSGSGPLDAIVARARASQDPAAPPPVKPPRVMPPADTIDPVSGEILEELNPKTGEILYESTDNPVSAPSSEVRIGNILRRLNAARGEPGSPGIEAMSPAAQIERAVSRVRAPKPPPESTMPPVKDAQAAPAEVVNAIGQKLAEGGIRSTPEEVSQAFAEAPGASLAEKAQNAVMQIVQSRRK